LRPEGEGQAEDDDKDAGDDEKLADPGPLEADPADRLLDLSSLKTGDGNAVDHSQWNFLEVDVQIAQVAAVELAVGAYVFLKGDATVRQDLLDAAAAFAVGTGVNDDFHSPLPPICPPLARVDR